MYQIRFYRFLAGNSELVSFNVTVNETDLQVYASKNLKKRVYRLVVKYRSAIEDYIKRNTEFLTTLNPYRIDNAAPKIIQEMINSTRKVSIGPMAAVAGAIADFVGRELIPYSNEVIIENGGDIFIKCKTPKRIGIYCGERSKFNNKLIIEIDPKDTPLGICTSSGTVGHSLSFGNTDATTVIAETATLADASATKIGNIVKKEDDITKGIEFAKTVSGIKGIIIVIGEKMAAWGDVKLAL